MIRQWLKSIFSISLFLFTSVLWSQTTGVFKGIIKDENGNPLSLVSVNIVGNTLATVSNDSGYFQLKIPYDKTLMIKYSLLGYQMQIQEICLQKEKSTEQTIVLLLEAKNISEVDITNDEERATGISRISIKEFKAIPNPSGNFETLLKTLPGVSSTNELTSQYSVRGGNFDENLVYVNDIEVIRPLLIETGQQEGLSFINPEMVSSVKFSSGGFEARYGDKMSSVLDVSYKKSTEFNASASASLLGGDVTSEGISKDKKFSYIAGLRYKTSQYLLSTLQTKGTYNPTFIDIQSFMSYQLTKNLEVSFLGNFTQNSYNFFPESRSTNFGTINQTYNLTIYYTGHELDQYQTALGAITFKLTPVSNVSLKLITSAYSSIEQETYDIEGDYYINELGGSNGSSSIQDSTLNLGIGTMLNHERNYFNINVYSVSHIGTLTSDNHQLRWSLEVKKEIINDNLNEWSLIDSAGYLTPYSPSSINLSNVANANNHLNNFRTQGFIQDAFQFSTDHMKYFLNGGIRFNYWSFNKQFLVTPRLRFAVKPDWNRDYIFFLATGLYFQPPFYKEMIDFQGNINQDILAQRSYHFVIGSDYNLKIWERPFKFTSEMYYKYINDLIPYIIDDVEIKYTARNNAAGFAEGVDLKLNGEFVPGLESWVSLSLLNTQEKRNETYVNSQGNLIKPGFYPRPTDQNVNFSLFFQDYLPSNPTYQLHMNLVYGSGLPVTDPYSNYFNQTFPLGPYRRVDLGVSKIFKNEKITSNYALFKPFKELIASLEVFNLFDIYNTASYLWVRTVSTQKNIPYEFAVPNYLTSRRLNLKITMRF